MDYKESLNLPKTDFPMKANLAKREPEMLARWEEMHIYRPDPRGLQGPEALHPPRRPPLRQRQHPSGHGAQQDHQGHRHQGEEHVGPRQHLRPRLGLPRPAHRAPGGQGTGRQEGRRCPRPTSAASAATYAEKFVGHPAGAVQAPRGLRRVGEPLPHHDLRLRGDRPSPSSGSSILNGSVYKGKKPVYWCASCKTALAEAEVEYDDHTTPSIYVKFPMISDIAGRPPETRRARRSPSSSGRRPPGRSRPTWPSPSTRNSSTSP